jgi:hypothetical protein
VDDPKKFVSPALVSRFEKKISLDLCGQVVEDYGWKRSGPLWDPQWRIGHLSGVAEPRDKILCLVLLLGSVIVFF